MLSRLTADLTRIAGETLDVQEISGAYYAFGSELACLRLFHKYNATARAENTRFGYSDNRATFFFCIEK